MSDKKNSYRVTSPIKHTGKRYEVDDTLLLTKEEAKGLHVELADAKPSGSAPEEPTSKASPSMGMSASGAVKVIESSDLKDLEGFVVTEEEGGTEDRKTVKAAWQKKVEEAEASEPAPKS